MPSGPPTPSTQPDTHAAEGALLASAGLGAPNIRQDLAQTPTQAGQGADLSAPQQQGTKATGLYAQPQQGPQGTKGGKDWMARNESWLVPLLSGVGTMAASPSRYFGGALLQGLGSAGETWQQTQTRQLERQKQATGIMSSQVGLAGETPGTKRVFDIATGQLVPVPLSDLMRDARLPPQQRKYSLTPISGATPVNALLQPAGETPQATSGTQPAVSGSAVVPATITSVFERNLEQVPARVEVNPESVNKDPDNMAAHNVRAAYHDVMQNQQNNNQMALSLLGMGAVSGPTAEPITVFKKTINGMLNAVGIQGFSDLSNQVTQDDINQKSAILNAMAATGGAGQTANQSLATALAAMPTRIQTPEARAALGFTMLQASQQIKDLGRVYNDLYAAHGDNPYAMQSFTGVEQAWRPNMSPVYALEKSIGSDLLNPQSGINQRTITLPDGSVQKFGEYLIKHAGAWEGDPKISGYLNKFYAPLINQSGVKYDVRQIGRYFQGE